MRRQPTIVIAGEFWLGATGRGFADGFGKLGWAVQEVDVGRHVGAFGSTLPGKVAQRLTNALARDAYRAAAVDACAVLRPDLFLAVKGTYLDGATLARIKETGARAIMYYPDYHFQHTGLDAPYDLYDHVFTTKSFQVAHLAAKLSPERVTFLHHGYSSSVHRPVYDRVEEGDFRHDILHVGNHSASKQAWLVPVEAAFPSQSLTIVGHRWREAAAGTPLAPAVLGRALVGLSYSMAVQTARINIAVHHGRTDAGWEDLVSTRTFELPAAGGFMLHIDNDEVRSLFDVGREIDVFSSPDELVDKCRFYLARADLRAGMIDRAYRRCVPAYSYDTRAAEMIAVLRG